mmetsp:Transcript_96445/g.201495  ORF Transcript_96445/g.201495 Transcript_96445/m.201495 type:complete len:614 (-) Transcript_96445:97-1938(-)
METLLLGLLFDCLIIVLLIGQFVHVDRRAPLDAVGRDVPVQDRAEDERSEDGGVEERPNGDGEGFLIDHVRGGSHLCNEVREFRTANHCPTDHEPGAAHETGTENLRHDAGSNAQERALPEGVEGHQTANRDGESDRAREEDSDHPRCESLGLSNPDVVGVTLLSSLVNASERHTSNEATPQVGSQEVGQGGVGNHDEHHQDEQRLVLDRDLGVSSSRRQSRNDPLVDGLRPELNRQAHCDDHESNADDGVDDSGHDIEVAPQAKQHVEQDQRQDVINEGGCDDSLAEVHLKNTSLTQQTKRNADACRSQGGADRNAVRRHGVSVKEHDQGAAHQRKDCADDSDEAGLRADHFGFVEVEVHSTLEDHEGDTGVADESEDVGVQAAFMRHFRQASFLETLRVARVLSATTAGRHSSGAGCSGRIVLPAQEVRRGASSGSSPSGCGCCCCRSSGGGGHGRMGSSGSGMSSGGCLGMTGLATGLALNVSLGQLGSVSCGVGACGVTMAVGRGMGVVGVVAGPMAARVAVGHVVQDFVPEALAGGQERLKIGGKCAIGVTLELAFCVLLRDEADDARTQNDARCDFQDDRRHAGQLRKLGCEPSGAQESANRKDRKV